MLLKAYYPLLVLWPSGNFNLQLVVARYVLVGGRGGGKKITNQ